MTVKIENRLSKKVPLFNIERRIKDLIKVVPQGHLIGLRKIIIVDTLLDKQAKNALAIYRKKNNNDLASIEISFNSLFQGMPKVLFWVPFVAKFTLAAALYHEIGHHYHYSFKHGINKKKKENFADNYEKEMLKKAFWLWRVLLFPIAPIVKYLSKKIA